MKINAFGAHCSTHSAYLMIFLCVGGTYLNNSAWADIPVSRAAKDEPIPLHVDVTEAVGHDEHRGCISLPIGRFPSSTVPTVASGRSIRCATATTVGPRGTVAARRGDTRRR